MGRNPRWRSALDRLRLGAISLTAVMVLAGCYAKTVGYTVDNSRVLKDDVGYFATAPGANTVLVLEDEFSLIGEDQTNGFQLFLEVAADRVREGRKYPFPSDVIKSFIAIEDRDVLAANRPNVRGHVRFRSVAKKYIQADVSLSRFYNYSYSGTVKFWRVPKFPLYGPPVNR